MSQVAGGVFPATVLHGVTYEVEVFLPIYIKRRHCPMGLGMLWFFFHAEDTVVFVELYDTRALELLDGGLLVAHDAAGAFGLGEVDELTEREIKEVVGSDDEEVCLVRTLP
jgi:hypothetical protein